MRASGYPGRSERKLLRKKARNVERPQSCFSTNPPTSGSSAMRRRQIHRRVETHRIHEHESRDELGVTRGERERHRAAERVTDDRGASEIERREEIRNDLGERPTSYEKRFDSGFSLSPNPGKSGAITRNSDDNSSITASHAP